MSALEQLLADLAKASARWRAAGYAELADHLDAIAADHTPVPYSLAGQPPALVTETIQVETTKPGALYNALLLGGARVAYRFTRDPQTARGMALASVTVAGVRVVINNTHEPRLPPARLAGELAEHQDDDVAIPAAAIGGP